jgi:hypothetical protein
MALILAFHAVMQLDSDPGSVTHRAALSQKFLFRAVTAVSSPSYHFLLLYHHHGQHHFLFRLTVKQPLTAAQGQPPPPLFHSPLFFFAAKSLPTI